MTASEVVAYCSSQMTDRASPTKAAKTAVVTETRTSTGIEPAEERALRMRHGFGVSDDFELEQVGQDNPDVAAKLREIELRALEMSGRLDELRAEVGLEADEDGDPDVKGKIIDKLSAQLADSD